MPCTVCFETGINKGVSEKSWLCKVCLATAFCSPECRQSHEKLHKMVCAAFATFIRMNPPPCQDAVMAIYLPAEQTAAKLIWVSETQSGNFNVVEMGSEFDKPVKKPYLGEGNPGVISIPIKEISIHKKNPGLYLPEVGDQGDGNEESLTRTVQLLDTIVIDCRATALNDGSKENLCATELAKDDKGQTTYTWLGPMVVRIVQEKTAYAPQGSRHITAADFHHVAMYLKSCGFGLENNLCKKLGPRVRGIRADIEAGMVSVKGVKIACEGEELLFGWKKYVALDIPLVHPHYMEALNMEATSVTTAMKLPLIVFKMKSARQMANTNWLAKAMEMGIKPFQHREAWVLNLDMNLASNTFGDVVIDRDGHRHWFADYLGASVVVAREDRKPISPQQVEGLARYFLEMLVPALDELKKREPEMNDKEKKKARMTVLVEYIWKNDCFEEFFKDLKQLKVEGGDQSWADVVSPFSI